MSAYEKPNQSGKKSAKKYRKKLEAAIGKYCFIILITVGREKTVFGPASVIAGIAKDMAIPTMAIFVNPLEEKSNPQPLISGIERIVLKWTVDSLMVVNSEEFEKENCGDQSIYEMFAGIIDFIVRIVHGLANAIYRQSTINLDISDLIRCFGGGGTIFAGFGEAEGKGKEEIAVQSALEMKHTVGNIRKASHVMVLVSGDVTTFDVSEAENRIHSICEERTEIIFALEQKDVSSDTLSVLVLANVGEEESAENNDKTNPVKVPEFLEAGIHEESKTESVSDTPETEEDDRKILILGIGRCGIKYCKRIMGYYPFLNYAFIDTDRSDLDDVENESGLLGNKVRKLLIGEDMTGGFGTACTPELGAMIADREENSLKDILDGFGIALLIFGAGGGTGAGTAPVIAGKAREMGLLTIGIAVAPGPEEPGKRQRIALMAVRDLECSTHTVIEVRKPDKESADEHSQMKYRPTGESVLEGMMQILLSEIKDSPGEKYMIKPSLIDYFMGAGRSYIGTGLGEGKHREENAAKSAFESLLKQGFPLKTPAKALLYVTGDLDTEDCADIKEYFRSRLNLNEVILLRREDDEDDELKGFFGENEWIEKRPDTMRVFAVVSPC